jgi:hypothetical protein
VKSDRTLLKWYRRINKRFFDGACPEKVCVRWVVDDEEERDRKWEETWFGEAERITEDHHDPYHDYQIVLSRVKNDSWIVKISTLVHEMIHLATDLKDDHGPAFEHWRQYVSDRGIFKKHALRKGNTLF